MLQDWIQKGYQYTSNPVFRRYSGRAGTLLAKPMKMALLLTTAYGKLVDINSTESGMQQLKHMMFTFVRMVRAYARGDYRDISRKSMLIGVTVLLYLVTPLDIIPDFIPVLGLMDDISIMAWFVDAFNKEITKYREWEIQTSYENIGRF